MAHEAVKAIGRGEAVIVPFDTVYGLVTTPHSREATMALNALKGRAPDSPAALVAADVDTLLELVPELRGRVGAIARALLPGPYTLIVPNPARRFAWISGSKLDTLGVRVPIVGGATAEILTGAGALVATSANLHGEPDPLRLDDVPASIRGACAVAVDGGQLAGNMSTIVDVTADEPTFPREGAASIAETLALIAAAA